MYNNSNYRFKHTCNDDNDIGRRSQQLMTLERILV